MKLPRRKFLHMAAAAAALSAVPRLAWAQTYPARPVRMIVATGPAGAPDILARLVGQWLSERLGQQFVTENRPGGGNNIGTEAVVRAPPDGYTLLLVDPSASINATLYEKLNYNFIRDIATVAGIVRMPLVMVVPVGTSHHGSGVDCLRQGQSGQNQHGLTGHWHSRSRRRGIVQDDDRHGDDSRPLSRRRARTDRPDWRTGASLLPEHILVD